MKRGAIHLSGTIHHPKATHYPLALAPTSLPTALVGHREKQGPVGAAGFKSLPIIQIKGSKRLFGSARNHQPVTHAYERQVGYEELYFSSSDSNSFF